MKVTEVASVKSGSDLVISATFTKTYPEPVGLLLQDFQISCGRGEIVVILGSSGSGKTTIINLLSGIIRPDKISDDLVPGVSVSGNFAYAFQRAELIPWRDCEMNAYFEADVLGVPRPTVRERVDRLLELTKLDSYKKLLPHQLSVGMQQRLQLVRVFARRAETYLCDEPLGAVDQPLKLVLAERLRELLKEDGIAAIWVTHDTLEAVTLADRVLVVGGRPLKVFTEHYVDRSITQRTNDGSQPSVAFKGGTLSLEDQAALLRESLYAVQQHEDAESHSPVIQDKGDSYKPANLRGLVERLYVLIPFTIMLIAWQVMAYLKPDLKFFISAPSEWGYLLFTELFYGPLAGHVLVTLRESLAGLGIGLTLGVGVGFISSSSRKLSLAVRPYLVGLTAIPLFVLAPAFILWFGIGEQMKVALAALSCLPIVGYLVHDAAAAAQGTYYRYLLSAGAKRRQVFAHLVFPSTLEGILLSIRPAAVAALIGAFLGEFIAANQGLGYYIVLQASRYHVAEVLAGVFLLFLTAIMADGLAQWVARRRTKIIARLGL